jgi:hypothetical protein
MLRKAIALIMETVSTSESSANFYETTWRNIPEDSHLQDLSTGSHVKLSFTGVLLA